MSISHKLLLKIFIYYICRLLSFKKDKYVMKSFFRYFKFWNETLFISILNFSIWLFNDQNIFHAILMKICVKNFNENMRILFGDCTSKYFNSLEF